MILPTAAPQGMDVRGTDDGGIRVAVRNDRKWWQIWRPWYNEIVLNQIAMIWLYQVIAKHMRKRVAGDNFDELQWDLQQAVASTRAKEWVVPVAEILRQKGWVKM